jgi:hypothetical protein
MVTHPLPPLPPRSQDDDEENEASQPSQTDAAIRGRYLEQTFAELGSVERESHSDLDAELVCVQDAIIIQTCNDDSEKDMRRKLLLADTLLPSVVGTSVARRDVDHRTEPHDILKHNRLSLTMGFADELGVQIEWGRARSYQEIAQTALQPSSPHVRFASPIYHPLPRTPSPPTPSLHRRTSRIWPPRPTLYGARPPPWGCLEDLELDRRYRIDIRASTDCLTERFELEGRRLAKERRLADEEIRAGKRWTEADELRELVCQIYPEMTFESNEGGRGRYRFWCCVVM